MRTINLTDEQVAALFAIVDQLKNNPATKRPYAMGIRILCIKILKEKGEPLNGTQIGYYLEKAGYKFTPKQIWDCLHQATNKGLIKKIGRGTYVAK